MRPATNSSETSTPSFPSASFASGSVKRWTTRRESSPFPPATIIPREKTIAAEAARANFVLATKNRMKIDEHRAVWIKDEAAEQEARAEGELEDFIVRKEEI